MEHEFDRTYWENHWDSGRTKSPGRAAPPVNPYLPTETAHLHPGTALDAGCGIGAEVLWLAEQGWQVTGVDISATALAAAAGRSVATGSADHVEWVETDVSTWEPDRSWDLVVTCYAHPASGQLAFYRHIASWVAPGGTLLIVGHHHDGRADDHHAHDNRGGHPETATADTAGITGLFTGPQWRIEAAYETTRTVIARERPVQLDDVIVRVRRSDCTPGPGCASR